MTTTDPRRWQWAVLGEDLQHLNFVCHWLRGRGVEGRIRKVALPSGAMAGEQYVRMHYAEEVGLLRRHNFQARGLVVVIDADTETVEKRQSSLDAQIKRGPGEPVLLAIPRRNIETWIRYLTAPPVDEETDYKRRERDAEACRRAALALARLRAPPADAPDSLRRFFAEIDRIG